MAFDARKLLLDMFEAAVDAASPGKCLPPHLPAAPAGRTIVVGAGKAAGAMAKAVEDHWTGPLEGLVVTRYGHGAPCRHIEVIEAGHPVPDAAGREAAERIFASVEGLTADDLVLCLISGGGSALLALPAPGVTLADKQGVNKALLKSGATISEMNCVRKHLSAIKGGKLAAAAAPARVIALLISDVPGDDPSVIASGPTVADPTTSADALAIIDKYQIAAPAHVRAYLESTQSETLKPGDPRLDGVVNKIIATPQMSLEAAAAVARSAGVAPLILANDIEGEARDVALVHAAIARQVYHFDQPAAAPCVLISGGETTVTVRGAGRGGRNAEFLLALGVALDGHAGIYSLAADTDGIDGTEDNAGALLFPDSLAKAAAAGVFAKDRLASNDGYGFFASLNNLVVTGPTRTNVNDFRAILVARQG
ncbi:glycerate kinase type-2 family protein [Methylocella tundrae]|uniref:Putative hydroxypyruvate reductase n=1 Tax=Methylocella tundrae TaxID=227605 RepID=A0A4U8Z4B0_METTU|nr:glycerate kinase [Methylocella tundrae]WPP04057.1 glycerate kinase [Methylocella tundrae]VFU10294.1 putative hydroxypyruvate reductase [Methylocella tundrae]